MLRQWVDAEQGLVSPGTLPVRKDLTAAEDGPFLDELKGSGFEAACQHIPVGRDRGSAACVVGMGVGHRVITLAPVHINHHSIERADTWHSPALLGSFGLDWPDRLEPDPGAATAVDLP